MTTTRKVRRVAAARSAWLTTVVGLCVVAAGLSLYLYATRAQDETDVVIGQRDATAVESADTAQTVLDLCQGGGEVAEVLRGDPDRPCEDAREVVADPVADPVGPRGEPGAAGEAGRSVRGPIGDRGEPGPAGEGLRGEPGADGQDSTVPGPAGPPGADSTAPGPAGPAGESVQGPRGAEGDRGRPPAGFSFTDGTGQMYQCTPNTAPDPGASPQYTCNTVASPPAPPSG